MANLTYLDSSFYIRWSQLTPSDVEPSIAQALSDAEKSIERITSLGLSEVSYQTTLLALEEAVEPLSVAWGKVSHLQSVCDSTELRAA